ncbi:MFS transporter permease [Microbacterium sp. S1037]|uniref:MFS transporter permease n=1 Tax=Microbacterium sp. S1037 TaxID=3398227 RepID=UPI003AADF519
MRAGRITTARRTRGVFIATGVGAGIVVLIALGLFLPLLGFLAGATASTAGLIPFPALSVTLATLVGVVIVAGLLLLALTRRRTGVAIVWVVLAVLVALAVTVFPLVAVASGSAERASDVAPLIGELWGRLTGGA